MLLPFLPKAPERAQQADLHPGDASEGIAVHIVGTMPGSRASRSPMLKSFAPNDRAEMVKDGKVEVTCEFCSSVYQFTPHEVGVE
jgi:molecular chaperone Hsp33